MQKKISVIIPTFRRPDLLVRCLRALFAQRLARTDFEIIIVTDGPDEETKQYLAPWLNNNGTFLSLLSLPMKKGPAAARNLGWLSARSPLVAFTDDDCLPDSNWLSTFLDAYAEEEAVAYCGRTLVPLPENPSDHALNTANLQDAEFITANCACTKSALIKVGGFDERFKLAWREDSDLQFKLLDLNIPIKKILDAVVVHPVREAPFGISVNEQKKGLYDALLFKVYPKLYRAKVQAKPLWNYYLINSLWILLIVSIINSNRSLFFFSSALLFFLLTVFIYKRLRRSDKSVRHVVEMISTSIVIPTLSVYWRIYGAIKYRVFFI